MAPEKRASSQKVRTSGALGDYSLLIYSNRKRKDEEQKARWEKTKEKIRKAKADPDYEKKFTEKWFGKE